MGVVNGSLVNPLIAVNGKIVPAIHKTPFKFLGRLVYPRFDQREDAVVVDKFVQLMEKTDQIKIDDRKKAWVYENGVLPAMTWDFMVYRCTDKGVSLMEACATRLLKKWLRLAKCADPSVLYRKEKGLGIKNVRTVCLKTQVNKEVLLSCSKDKTVRLTASSRREDEAEKPGKWKPGKVLDDAVQRVTYKHAFQGQSDRRGLGHGIFRDKSPGRKEIAQEVCKMTEEQMIPHILSLAEQSKWLEWDNVINLDMKWKEMMYALSPSMLSFVFNSVQDTLPHPKNLRRWKLDVEAACGLCGWKNVGLVHILCGCKVALEQGRISFRHDSILKVITKALTKKIEAVEEIVPLQNGVQRVNFVKPGQKTKKKKKPPLSGLLDTAKDWVVGMDTRQKQVHFPPHIMVTSDRPDLVIYSNTTRNVIIIELTSPAEENIEKWRSIKTSKYEKLAENIREAGTWKPTVFTIEVGARGYVAKQTNYVWRKLGIAQKDSHQLTERISRVAMRCSHFLWICRNTKIWTSPSEGV